MRSFVKSLLLTLLVLGLAVSTLAQNPGPTPPGLIINWTITLAPLTAGGPSGTSQYVTYKPSLTGKANMKFLVECEYADYTDGTILDVYIKGPNSSIEPPIMVGSMEVRNHSASLLLLTSNAPEIKKGTQVLVKTQAGAEVMVGHF